MPWGCPLDNTPDIGGGIGVEAGGGAGAGAYDGVDLHPPKKREITTSKETRIKIVFFIIPLLSLATYPLLLAPCYLLLSPSHSHSMVEGGLEVIS
jgi:hypothetical protein